jgi:hypothetical protein
MSGAGGGGGIGELADGRGISALTGRKLVKDFAADFLLTVAAGGGSLVLLAALGFRTGDGEVGVLSIALIGAAVRAAYRVVLRWATSP